MVAYFQLQPSETELQQLADEYWQKAGEKEHELEKAAFEAGEAIRNGDFTLANLEAIVRWKSERVVHYLIGNSNEKIGRALSIAAAPGPRPMPQSRRCLSCTAWIFRRLCNPGRNLPGAVYGAGFSRPRGAGPCPSRRALL